MRLFVINLFVFLFIFFVCECLLRVVFSSNTVLNINIGGYKEYHPTRGTKLKPNYNVGDINTNSHSFLGPEFDIGNSQNNLRILTIGNSVTFAPAKRNYSRVLEDKLKNKFDNIEVICGAVPGYDSFDVLDWHDEFFYKLKPDISIIYIGWNDLGQFQPFGLKYKTEKLSYSRKTIRGFLEENLFLMRIPYFFIGRAERQKPVDNSEMTDIEKDALSQFYPSHYLNNLNALIKKLKGNGTKVYVIPLAGLVTHKNITQEEKQLIRFPRGMNRKYNLYKGTYLKYTQALDSVIKINNVEMIDIRELIKTPADREIFTDDCHINLEGAEVFGSFISESISEYVDSLQNLRNYNFE